MQIRSAVYGDADWILAYDRWISPETLHQKIGMGQVYVAVDGSQLLGWLRYGLFWDNTPFLYMLHILEHHRGTGIGTALLAYWEQDMKRLGYTAAMTSTAQTESAQHFYTKQGYQAVGSFLLPKEPLEILFVKAI